MEADFFFDRASPADIPLLLNLYDRVYSGRYTMALGTDSHVMHRLLEDSLNAWFVFRTGPDSQLAAAALFEYDFRSDLYKLEGVVVNPEMRQCRLAHRLIDEGIRHLQTIRGKPLSFLSLARTKSLASQRMLLANGFVPAGIFLNSHRLEEVEHLAVMVRLSPERAALRREGLFPFPGHSPQNVSGSLSGIVLCEATNAFIKTSDRHSAFRLHVAKNGAATILDAPLKELNGTAWLREMKEKIRPWGAPSIQVMIEADHTDTLGSFLSHGFMPTALYPAYVHRPRSYCDAIQLAYPLEPVKWTNLDIDPAVEPFFKACQAEMNTLRNEAENAEAVRREYEQLRSW